MKSKERKRKMWKCEEKWGKIQREIIDIEIKMDRDGKNKTLKKIKKKTNKLWELIVKLVGFDYH